jgi:hypothetical protein
VRLRTFCWLQEREAKAGKADAFLDAQSGFALLDKKEAQDEGVSQWRAQPGSTHTLSPHDWPFPS